MCTGGHLPVLGLLFMLASHADAACSGGSVHYTEDTLGRGRLPPGCHRAPRHVAESPRFALIGLRDKNKGDKLLCVPSGPAKHPPEPRTGPRAISISFPQSSPDRTIHPTGRQNNSAGLLLFASFLH